MVYIAPPQQQKQQKRQQPTTVGKAGRGKADQQELGRPGKNNRNQRPGHLQSTDAVRSKQDLLDELTRQAEWHTVVLQREQAALKALQDSKSGVFGSQSPPHGNSGTAASAYDSSSSMGPPAGLAPVAVKPNNHMFFNVTPKTVDPSKVPGLAGSAAAPSATPAQAARQRIQPPQQQQQQSPPGRVSAAANKPTGRQQPAVQQQQQQQRGVRPAATGRNAAGKPKQPQGQNAQQKQQLPAKGKGQNQRVPALPAAAAEEADTDATDDADAASPFADADWRFDFPTEGGAPIAAGGRNPRNQTFPDEPGFRTGQVFEIPADENLSGGQYPVPGLPAAGNRQSVGYYGPVGGPGGRYVAGAPDKRVQQQQQQQQMWQQQGHPAVMQLQQQQPWSPTHQYQQQQQQQQYTKTPAEELADQLQAAQAHPDPAVRDRLIRELKQKQYKLELEQQIAEREASRQAAKVAAAAREAAEEARRAAAPPPWDPAVRAGRRGGGGEPLRGADGAQVANLRAMKSQLALHDESSQPHLSNNPTQQQYQQQLPSSFHPGQLQLAAGGAMGGLQASPSAADVGGGVTNRGKTFMGAMNELRPGLSQEQQQAAAAARQQLQADLQAQIADKAARAAAQAAAEAAKTAQEEEALRRYYAQQQQQQQGPNASSSTANVLQANQGLVAEASRGFGGLQNATSLGNGGFVAAISGAADGAGRKGRSKHVIDAPWLDQLQQQQQPQQQQQRQPGQPGLRSEASSSQSNAFSPPAAGPSGADVVAAPMGGLQHQPSAARRLGGLGSTANMSSQQLATALQDLQEEQALMWQEFTRQAQVVEQLLQEKEAAAADGQAARAELERMRAVLEQQQALRQEYEDQQLQQQGGLPRMRSVGGPQQQQWGLQQQQRLGQQHSVVQISPSQQQLGAAQGLQEAALDAFVVETHMVPITASSLHESDSFMQLVASQPAVAGNSTLRSSQAQTAAGMHLSLVRKLKLQTTAWSPSHMSHQACYSQTVPGQA